MEPATDRPPIWAPVQPPLRCEKSLGKLAEFYAHILTPGFSHAFHAATLGKSLTSIATYRAKALQAAQEDPTIMDLVRARVRAIGPEQCLAMAQARGSSQLPYWSRMGMFEYRKRGLSRAEIADAFRCSVGTVANVLQGKGISFSPLSAVRQLTHAQKDPPGRWVRAHPR